MTSPHLPETHVPTATGRCQGMCIPSVAWQSSLRPGLRTWMQEPASCPSDNGARRTVSSRAGGRRPRCRVPDGGRGRLRFESSRPSEAAALGEDGQPASHARRSVSEIMRGRGGTRAAAVESSSWGGRARGPVQADTSHTAPYRAVQSRRHGGQRGFSPWSSA